MSETDRAPGDGDAYGWSFEATERRQLLRGLELTPLERLRWLERAKEELASLLGRASSGPEAGGDRETAGEAARR